MTAEKQASTPVPVPPIPNDDGTASPAIVAALANAAIDGSGEQVLAALAASRLFVPVVAMAEGVETNPATGLSQDKHSSMASVSIQDREGRRSMLAFTSIAELRQFKSDARPVPVSAPLAAQAAIAEQSDALLIDISGATPFAVVGAELRLLASVSGEGAANVGVRASFAEALRAEPDVLDAFLVDRHDWLELTLVLSPQLPQETYETLVGRISTQLRQDRALASQRKAALKVRVVTPDDPTLGDETRDTPSLIPDR